MTKSNDPGFEKNYGLMDYKRPPKPMVNAARRERDRRKECHGTWSPCDTVHSEEES